MRVLIIDDIPEAVDPLCCEIHELHWESVVHEFTNFESKIDDWNPDVVVIDLMKNAADIEGHGGIGVFDIIWENRFRPIVVYSADPSLIKQIVHPLVKYVTKGSGSERVVMGHLNDYDLYVEAIREVQTELIEIGKTALKYLFNYESTSHFDANQFQHLFKRRIAATLDVVKDEGPKPPAHFRYIVPPIGDYPKLGDVIQCLATGEYKIVLTPSCDMVCKHPVRLAKVRQVLVAACKTPCKNDAHELGITGDLEADSMILSQGFIKTRMPLPKLGSLLPDLVIHIKAIELININRKTGEVEDHKRIASLDSPFREQVSWAFIQNSGRPGIPDCDYETWAQEMNDALKQ
jgi:CTP synthase